ncbi:OLC1v1022330C1 [Oldenlandia corymbosa var. corymbosa]|uniref:OLC1v1022330C1 n=1 Tax=Oldenlandia corymbosa var. corymbosa TaxID=529605 RepID=A0AAV1C0F3_OLDCO|nr:OLC1v1022330C1 [Oldenlandia corymbosa var. corymbosa]
MMLGSSFASSSSHEDHGQEDDPPSSSSSVIPYHQIHHHQLGSLISASASSPSAIHHNMRQLLISCAELISTRPSDLTSAHRLLTILMANSNPHGDSTERLIHHFTKALSLRLSTTTTTTFFITPPPPPATTTTLMISTTTNNNTHHDRHHHQLAFSSSTSTTSIISSNINSPQQQQYLLVESSSSPAAQAALIQSSYLSLNQVTPFIRFSQLTANQAILDSIQQEAIHILDFDIMHGLQWPPFMQAIKEKYPQPTLRITGTGNDLETLRRTGDRLAKFAHSLDLSFQFHPLLVPNDEDDPTALASSVVLLPNETLAVNCVHYLHRLHKNRDGVRFFLHAIKGMNPSIVTMAEREANHNHPLFLQRFVEALDHYAAVFDSLEATLPPTSRERLNVEQVLFGREIIDIVAQEGDGRKQRHERFRSWELLFRSCGFRSVPLSPFALSQAKLLLRLHYPSEGYQLHILDDSSLFLGWQNQPLFSVSSWR